MRRRQLKALWKRLRQLAQMKLTRDQLLLKLGAARQSSPSAWRLVEVEVAGGRQATLQYRLNKTKLRQVKRGEGHYLLRTNLEGRTPEEFWRFYMQLVRVEEAFRNLKGDLAIRPIYHQAEARIEAHIFVTFLAYCLQVTLAQRLKGVRVGLDAALGAGATGGDANDRRAGSDGRRPLAGNVALHPAGQGPAVDAGDAQTGIAGATAPENHRPRLGRPRRLW